MPGPSPYEAVQAFLEPLQRAIACVARAKITLSRGGHHQVEKPHTCTLNDGEGASVAAELTFRALLQYKIIQDSENGPYRVTTLGYDYSLAHDELRQELFAFHWHPAGRSAYTLPHLHLGQRVLAIDGPLSPAAHLPTPRVTFETAIRWAIECGVTPLCADWPDRLAGTEEPHLANRTWDVTPPERRYIGQHRRQR